MDEARATAEPSDAQLLRSAQAGDYAGFEALVRRYRDRVYRLALGMTKDPSDAEEVAQEAFLSAFKGLSTFRGDSAVSTWLFRITANAALMKLRSRRRKPLLSIEDHPQPGDRGALWALGDWAKKPEEQILTAEVRRSIEDTIAALPEKYRAVLLMRDVEGLGNHEVADILGLSLPTVKARLHRARLLVREAIERHFEKP